jgi:hypothetical protein
MRLVTVSLLASATLLSACGGGSKPPASGGDNKGDASAETFSEVNPADVAELDAGGGAKEPPAATAATPSAPPAAAPEPPKDECTPVGVDFEKRARPKVKECYATGKKKDPNLQGTVRIAVEIGDSGKIKNTKITEKTLPDPVAQCMLKVVKATPLPDAPKCSGRTLTIPVTFPTPP